MQKLMEVATSYHLDMERNELLSIFHNFDDFLEIYENPYWFKIATTAKMDMLFCSALVLERIYKDLLAKGLLSHFQKKLQEWWIHRGAPYEYEIKFFECSCDKVFYNLIVNSENISKIENTVTSYLKHCGAERLNNMTNELLMDGSCYRMLANLTKDNGTMEYDTKGQLLLSFWVKELNRGRKDNIISHIQSIEVGSIPIILYILSLQTSNPEHLQVQMVVLDTILAKINEDDFFTRIASVGGPLLVSVSERYPSWMDALTLKVTQIGRQYSYECEDGVYIWINKEVNISYKKFVLLFQHLYGSHGLLRTKILSFLQRVITEPHCTFWENVASDCCIYM